MLVKCPECGGYVSDIAVSCPHCGYPLEEKRKEEEELMDMAQSYWDIERGK